MSRRGRAASTRGHEVVGVVSRRRLVAGVLAFFVAPACNKPYRVGDHVWVEWEGRDYPAYILAVKTKRFRVHYDGFDERWDEDVTIERIKGRIAGEVRVPPPPPKVTRAMGAARPKPSSSAALASPYRAGDRVRVRWRGSVYSATVLEVKAPDSVRVHYDGHEDAWNETVPIDRIVGPK